MAAFGKFPREFGLFLQKWEKWIDLESVLYVWAQFEVRNKKLGANSGPTSSGAMTYFMVALTSSNIKLVNATIKYGG
jgi:hypothetical protein